ncbi:hypothetical protein CDL12_13579 [Handroanthus impetiginosus]|uniref:S-protein homolog n=1 Tax=Handroanthus impetiginosus TaxID=429701 RepID=A0A2G9H8G0_9LAMI|nr:hypothetical protein CDL12_13579 [Handroanthus impetiginosus]
MKSFFTLLVLWLYLSDLTKTLCSFDAKFSSKLQPFEPFTVYVTNNLPNNSPPLFIHCASGDNELGNHKLYVNNNFHWSFKLNFRQTTLYFCRFRWRGRNVAFDVFNTGIGDKCEGPHGNLCAWFVKQDGFYFGNDLPPRGLTKLHDW